MVVGGSKREKRRKEKGRRREGGRVTVESEKAEGLAFLP